MRPEIGAASAALESMPDSLVPLTRHDLCGSPYQGCSQKTLAPLATFLSRYRGVATSNLQMQWHRHSCLCRAAKPRASLDLFTIPHAPPTPPRPRGLAHRRRLRAVVS